MHGYTGGVLINAQEIIQAPLPKRDWRASVFPTLGSKFPPSRRIFECSYCFEKSLIQQQGPQWSAVLTSRLFTLQNRTCGRHTARVDSSDLWFPGVYSEGALSCTLGSRAVVVTRWISTTWSNGPKETEGCGWELWVCWGAPLSLQWAEAQGTEDTVSCAALQGNSTGTHIECPQAPLTSLQS